MTNINNTPIREELEETLKAKEEATLKVDYLSILAQIQEGLVLVAATLPAAELTAIRDAETLEQQLRIINRLIYINTDVDISTIIDNIEDVTHEEVRATISTIVGNLITVLNKDNRLYKVIAWVSSAVAAILIVAPVVINLIS